MSGALFNSDLYKKPNHCYIEFYIIHSHSVILCNAVVENCCFCKKLLRLDQPRHVSCALLLNHQFAKNSLCTSMVWFTSISLYQSMALFSLCTKAHVAYVCGCSVVCRKQLLATGDALGVIKVWKLSDELTAESAAERELLSELADTSTQE